MGRLQAAASHQRWCWQSVAGSGPRPPPLAALPGTTQPPPSPELQLGSRYFGFYRDGDSQKMSSHVVPLLELINHSDQPNAQRGGARVRWERGGSRACRSREAGRAGERKGSMPRGEVGHAGEPALPDKPLQGGMRRPAVPGRGGHSHCQQPSSGCCGSCQLVGWRAPSRIHVLLLVLQTTAATSSSRRCSQSRRGRRVSGARRRAC